VKSFPSSGVNTPASSLQCRVSRSSGEQERGERWTGVQPSRGQKASSQGSGTSQNIGLPRGREGFIMFISPAKPQMDVVSLRDNVFTFAASEFAPWLFQLNQINTALFLHQQRLHDMSYNQMSLKSGWSQSGLKQQPPQHGLSMSGTGFYPETTVS
jgi:hypothetical protein